MKKLSVITCAITLCIAAFSPLRSDAQLMKPMYFNVDWQFNAPVSNNYADVASGWGMSFETGYYVMPRLAVGLYFSYHTNHKYVGEQVLQLSNTSSLYTDQQHSIFQMPFGALVKYRMGNGKHWEPYVSMKVGAMYTQMNSYTQVVKFYNNSWGFNMQPEAGLTFYPMPHKRCGIHLAIYYNFSSNKNKTLTYDIDCYNNIGFHLGVAF